ncbi:MAG: hypothetical protein KDK25_14875, partial [Leptospiraceae bacterium]|nr:hypothetical protein [Leptospiraceae bacterium]
MDVEPLKRDSGEVEVTLDSICILEPSLAHYQDSLPENLQVLLLPENDYLPDLEPPAEEDRRMQLVVFLATRDFLERFRLDL